MKVFGLVLVLFLLVGCASTGSLVLISSIPNLELERFKTISMEVSSKVADFKKEEEIQLLQFIIEELKETRWRIIDDNTADLKLAIVVTDFQRGSGAMARYILGYFAKGSFVKMEVTLYSNADIISNAVAEGSASIVNPIWVDLTNQAIKEASQQIANFLSVKGSPQ